jgi:hypothetical protein
MKPGTIVCLPDGRIGTICWHHLDGYGGVWGVHDFSLIKEDFSDELPLPQFMLRKKSVEPLLRRGGHRPDVECVGENHQVVEDESETANA